MGGFDERFFLYEEDVDLCLRVRQAGWGVAYVPEAVVVHGLGHSMSQAPARARLEYHRSHLRFYAKHNGPLATAALRALIAAGGVLGWLAALGPGADRQERRRHHAEVLRAVRAPNGRRFPGRPAAR